MMDKLQRPRVLIVSHSFPCFAGDWRANFIESLADAYGDQADVTVFVPYVYTWKRPRNGFLESGKVKIICYKYLPWDKLHTLGVEPIMKGDLTLNLSKVLAIPFLFLVGIIKLSRLLRREHFDMVQAHWAIPNTLMVLAAKLLAGAKATKVFSSFPGSDVTVLTALGPLRSLVAKAIAKSDYLSCNSSDLRDDLVAAGIAKERIDLVIYGVDEKKVYFDAAARQRIRQELGLDESTTALLMLGRFVPKKGFIYGLRAMPDILRTAPHTQMLIIGDGERKAEFLSFVHANKLEKHVRFLGKVPLDRLKEYYSAADIFVMPSQRLPSDGLNVVVPEAMACGRPIVASNVGGNDLVVFEGQNGFLHDAQDVGQLAAKVVDLIHDKQLQRNMGEKSLELIQTRFNWQAIARYYLSRLSS